MISPRRRPAASCAPALLFAVTLAVVAGCVPQPVGRASGGPGTSGVPSPVATVRPTAVPTGPEPPPSFVRPTPTPLPTFASYVVKSGDTLTSIARTHGTTARSLAFWNRVRYPSLDPDAASYDPNRIKIGWVLLLVPDTEIDEDSTFPE